MPTVRIGPGPHRYFFYSFDCCEPMQVHIQRERKLCKFWLERVSLARNAGGSAQELNGLRRTIKNNLPVIKEAWHEHRG